MWIDAHLHLEAEEFEDDRDEIVARAAAAGVTLMISAATSISDAARVVALTRRYLGVRVAVGASPAAIGRMIGLQAGSWVVTGIAAGLVTSLVLGHLARSLLFRVSPSDPLSIAAAVAILTLAAALSAWSPTRHAARVDPAVSLQQE